MFTTPSTNGTSFYHRGDYQLMQAVQTNMAFEWYPLSPLGDSFMMNDNIILDTLCQGYYPRSVQEIV